MFTGIIEAVGTVRGFHNKKKVDELEIQTNRSTILKGLKIGGSLAVNGACLTVIRKGKGSVFFNLVDETLKRTVLGALKTGERVNLERPLKAGARIEGHFVLGHVDGVGGVTQVLPMKRGKSFFISCPKALKPYVVEKGSVAVNGVSLTTGKVSGKGFWVHCIPHTSKKTNLGELRLGSRVNLEADILAKLVR